MLSHNLCVWARSLARGWLLGVSQTPLSRSLRLRSLHLVCRAVELGTDKPKKVEVQEPGQEPPLRVEVPGPPPGMPRTSACPSCDPGMNAPGIRHSKRCQQGQAEFRDAQDGRPAGSALSKAVEPPMSLPDLEVAVHDVPMGAEAPEPTRLIARKPSQPTED